jgi:hypothetical protein
MKKEAINFAKFLSFECRIIYIIFGIRIMQLGKTATGKTLMPNIGTTERKL